MLSIIPSDLITFIIGSIVALLVTYFSVRWGSFRQALKELIDVIQAFLKLVDEDSTPEELEELRKQIKEFLEALKNTFLAKLLGISKWL